MIALASVFAVFGKLLLIGVDDDHAAVAVDDDGVAAADFRGDISQPDDRRDAHGAGDDGGMAGAAADVGGEAFHVARSSAAVWHGKQIVGDDHDVLRAGGAGLRCFWPISVRSRRLFDVVDILHALGEIRVGHRPETCWRIAA